MSEPKPFVEVAVRVPLAESYESGSGTSTVAVETLETTLAQQRKWGWTPAYLEVETGYEVGDETVVLVCRRPETDAERDTRVALADQRAEEQADLERHQYEKLKKKFEGK